MDAMKHEYPSEYPPGKHWAIDEAWRILDSLKPDALDISQRSFIAGMIAGALMKAKANGHSNHLGPRQTDDTDRD